MNISVTPVIPDSTKVIPTAIERNKQSAIYFCATVMLQLSVSTTEFGRGIMAVLQDNTEEQQKKTKELVNLPMLKVPPLEKDSDKSHAQVQAYQASNEQISAQRQLVQQELSTAQQRAQSNQKTVNANTTESMEVLQATSALLSTLEELTIKANLTSSSSN